MRRYSGRCGVFDGFGRILNMVVCHGAEKSGGEAKVHCHYAFSVLGLLSLHPH